MKWQMMLQFNDFAHSPQICIYLMSQPNPTNHRRSSNRKHHQEAVPIREVSGYLPQRYMLPEGYSASPSQQQIFANAGKCVNLTISTPYGQARWNGAIDIATIKHPLAHIVRMAHREIEVYQNDCGSPQRGLQLNRPCLVTFKTDTRLNHCNLACICKKNGTKLVDCQFEAGHFTVLIPHFTKYNFNDGDSTEKKAKARSDASRATSNTYPINQSFASQAPSKINTTSSRSSPSKNQLNGHSLPSNINQQNVTNSRKQPKQKTNSNMFGNFKMDEEKQQLNQTHSPQTQIGENNAVSFIMNAISKKQKEQAAAISKKQEEEAAAKVQQRVFEKICNWIQKDQVYYNKQIKSSLPATKQDLLSAQNSIRDCLGQQTLQIEEFDQLRLSHAFAAEGNVITCKRYQCDSQPFLEVINFKPSHHPQSQIQNQFSFFGLMTKNNEFTALSIANISNNQSYPLSIRRLLSLFSILFHDQVYLSINRNVKQEYEMKLLQTPKINTDDCRMDLFKNWLAWVARDEFQPRLSKENLFLFNTKLNNALALRRPEDAIQFLYVNNRWDDARLIINIEDPAIRPYYSSRNYQLATQLQAILSQNIESLSKGINDWFLLMAFSVWYLKKGSTIENLNAAMEIIKPETVNHLHEQFRLIQLFLVKNGKKPYKSVLLTPRNKDLTSQRLSCLYLLSNHFDLAQYEQAIITNSPNQNIKNHLYATYRYQILRKLAQLHSSNPFMIELVNNDKFLSQIEKESIIKKLQPKGREQCRDHANLAQGNQLISQGRIMEGLSLIFEMGKWNDPVFKKVCQLVTQPHLLTGYKRATNQSLRRLLQQRGETFADLLLILAIGRSQRLTCQQSVRLVDILQRKSRFSKYLCPAVHSFLLNGLQKIILEAIVLRNQFLDYIIKDGETMNAINELFKEKINVFKKMEQATACL